MARTKISEFSATAADNTDIDNINIAEGCAPSGINNAIRELMSQLKDMQTGASGDTFTLTAVNSTTVDTTNLEVTNLKAKDGTAAGSIADATGVVTLGSSVLTTADINGGTIDNASIGATTPSTVVATQVDITSQGDLRLQDTTGGQYVALQAPGTVASSYTLTLPVDDGTAGQALITDGSGVLSWSTAASGDVYGPASATDNAVARYDSTTGKIIQNSAVTIADDGATVIDANSTSAALRITQFGTGNALLVEDSANPDATPTVIAADGTVISGTTSSLGSFAAVQSRFQSVSTGNDAGYAAFRYSADTVGVINTFSKSRGGLAAQGIVSNNDEIARLTFTASDGSAFIQAALIRAEVDGTPGTNDMPGRLVFSTTADGASSPTERMRIDNAGRVGLGGVDANSTLTNFRANSTTDSYGFYNVPSFTSATTNGQSFTSAVGAASGSALSFVQHFRAQQGTFIGTVTTQYGFHAASSLTGATNNYGFYSNIASGTGRWNFYAAGSADNYFAGNVGIGATPVAKLDVYAASGYVDARVRSGSNQTYMATDGTASYIGTYSNIPLLFSTNNVERMRIGADGGIGIGGFNVAGYKVLNYGNWTGATTYYGFAAQGTIQSDVTTNTYSYRSAPNTVAAAFTLANLYHYIAQPGTIGAGSAITNQFGFFAGAITGATNNYGFYSNIASGTGRWNFYAAGTADNYFAGSVGIGATANASAILDVQSTTKGVRMPNMTTAQKNAIASPAAGLMVFDTTLSKLSVYTGAAWQTITSV